MTPYKKHFEVSSVISTILEMEKLRFTEKFVLCTRPELGSGRAGSEYITVPKFPN